MRIKFSSMWRVGLALVLVLSLSLVMAAPVAAAHTSSATIAFATGESNVTGAGSILDVTVTNDAASADDIHVVKIDFTDSDFTVTAEGADVDGWGKAKSGAVVTYTATSGDIAQGASVTFSPTVTNPAVAGDAVVPAVLTTDAGTQASLDAALDTGWIGYVADSVGVGGNNITVEYRDPGFPNNDLSVSVAGTAITVSLKTVNSVLTSTASEVATAIEDDSGAGGAALLVNAAADGGHLTYVVQALTVPAFTGGTSPDVDKDCPVTPGTLTVIGPKPTVTNVQPDSGNVDETMWVEVTGTNFTGTTTACTTSFDFGTTEVKVVAGSYHWVNAQQVDCQIEIIAAGAARYVIPTTSREGTNTTAQFDPNAAGSAQVDVWDTYTPVESLAADNWTAATLAMSGTADNNKVYTTIVAAVDSVGDGSGRVIRVHEATYNPQGGAPALERFAINIDQNQVNLVAFGSPVIVPVRTSGTAFELGVIYITAGSVTVDGFTLQNATPWATGDCGIKARGDSGGINFTIKNNTVSGFGDAATDLPSGANTRAIEAYNAANTGTISGNTVEDNRLGIQVTGSDTVTISGNLVQNNFYGIAFFNDPTGAVVIKNRVLSNYCGIDVNGTADVGIFYTNDIVGNTRGFNNCASADQDARYNWWGDISGPSAYDHLSAALGSGDTVNDGTNTKDVLYEPWLTEDQSTTVTSGKAYLGSTMELESGWNTLSVPLALKGSADTLTEIAALGDFLTDTNWESAYQYNPTGVWETPTELVPGRGYYIKTLAAVSFPVLYSGELGLPANELAAGWNLVGSAFGIDKVVDPGFGTANDNLYNKGDYGIATPDADADGDPTDITVATDPLIGHIDAVEDAESYKAVDTALDSIAASCSVIVSPTVPGQVAAWATTVAAEQDSPTYSVCVGEAYWVFMTDSGTLAGFEVTPIYKLFLQ